MKIQLLSLSFALISVQIARAQTSPKVSFGSQPAMISGKAPEGSAMYCDSGVGWCQRDKSAQIYSFTPQDQRITIDFKDISEKPADADLDGQ